MDCALQTGNGGSKDPLAGSTYQVPADVEVRYIGKTTNAQGTFFTYQKIADYFSEQAGVEGGDGLFCGSANSTFSSESYESNSYFYGIYETFAERWSINLDNALLYAQGVANGSAWDVTFAEDANGLTAPFDPTQSDCVAKYQEFFTRYGTHIVGVVTVGARSRLSVAVERESNISESDASVDISAEYDMVTGSFGTKASYKNSNYEKSRNSQFLAMGGDQTLATIASGDPAGSAGPNQTNYEKWLATTDTDPSAIQITLIGLWQLCVFTPDVRTALEEAYNYFALPNSVLAFYCYVGSNEGDYLYTTLEQSEGPGIRFASYHPQGVPFYVLPQGTRCSKAVRLYRYYNKNLHFFTTDPTTDAEIITNGHYAQDSAYYSEVLPLDTLQGLNSTKSQNRGRFASRANLVTC